MSKLSRAAHTATKVTHCAAPLFLSCNVVSCRWAHDIRRRIFANRCSTNMKRRPTFFLIDHIPINFVFFCVSSFRRQYLAHGRRRPKPKVSETPTPVTTKQSGVARSHCLIVEPVCCLVCSFLKQINPPCSELETCQGCVPALPSSSQTRHTVTCVFLFNISNSLRSGWSLELVIIFHFFDS